MLNNTVIKTNDYNIIITQDRTLEAAFKYYVINEKKEKIGVLNFASANHPGGGVWNGARAQEESLCRALFIHALIQNI